jgi:hypothetical protein
VKFGTLILPAALLLLAGSTAEAAQFSFDVASGDVVDRPDSIIPVGLVVAVSLIGALLIVLERKKARGIWSTNDRRLR